MPGLMGHEAAVLARVGRLLKGLVAISCSALLVGQCGELAGSLRTS